MLHNRQEHYYEPRKNAQQLSVHLDRGRSGLRRVHYNSWLFILPVGLYITSMYVQSDSIVSINILNFHFMEGILLENY